jgi:hypothetical protein
MRDRVMAQRGEKRQRLPLAMRDLGDGLLAAAEPAARTGHVDFGPGLIKENKAPWINPSLVFFSAQPAPQDDPARREHSFLKLISWLFRKRHSVSPETEAPRSRNSLRTA